MYVSHVKLKNWRNFQSVDVRLGERVFIVGPNASGKSNFLDAFRFLRDVAQSGGGLQKAVKDRDGLSKIRCLAARQDPDVVIDIELSDPGKLSPLWRYAIGIKQQPRGDRKPLLIYEHVWQNGKQILSRPDDKDEHDPDRLTQTHVEQISANQLFRDVAKFLESTSYLHLVPQLVRHPREFSGPGISGDPYGRSFLEKIARTPEKTRRARLRAIEKALVVAVPQIKELTHVTDREEGGVPHLEAVYEHWRPHGARQRENQFSDGTLRLIGLMWSLLDGESLLLLEEPELSLNSAIVQRLPGLIHRARKKRNRQVMISTHSADLLSDKGIDAQEVLMLTPQSEGTKVETAYSVRDVRQLLEGGLSVADAVLPRIAPQKADQLDLFEHR